jgi:di/tricarboxylate transporter
MISLAALAGAILASCFAPVNVGFLSIALAFLIGYFLAGMNVAAIAAGFPSALFLTLTGSTLLFAQASVNGTLDKVARRAVRLAFGNRGVVPIVFFVLAAALGAGGAGGIAAAALLAPVAMGVAEEMGISSFLMAIMLANGANAGTFSPIAPTGIIARGMMARIGLQGMEWPNFFNTLAAQSFVAFAGYLLLGGWSLFRRGAAERAAETADEPFDGRQRITLAVLVALLLSVVFLRADVGLAAFVAAAVLSAFRAADEEAAVKAMPWNIILMVSGVTVLIEVLGKTGGMDLFTGMLARVSHPHYIAGVIAFVTGMISVYSSSSGVVLPMFLPTVPGLIAKLGGGNPLMIAYSINVGAHLVDVSPLSTVGALCIAGASARTDRAALFRKLMAWGWSMSIVGALVCQAFFGFR